MKLVHSEMHRRRQARSELYGGELRPPFECPARIDFILEEARSRGFGALVPPEAFGLDPVLAVHDPRYVSFLESAWRDWTAAGYRGEAIPNIWPARSLRGDVVPRHIDARLGYYSLAGETSISDGTWEAALASKDVALTALAQILAGAPASFGACRPPGHHASVDQFGGYCFFNNAAIAAQFARDRGVARVAILDVDFHHGNGTQQIFYHRDDILFASLHGDPEDAFPHFLGFADETGRGAGLGFNINYPMPQGTGFGPWRTALLDACDRIRHFAPGLLIVSLGVDTFERDPISFFGLTSDDYSTLGQDVAALGVPTLFLLEGGYAVEEIGRNTINTLCGFWQAAAAAESPA